MQCSICREKTPYDKMMFQYVCFGMISLNDLKSQIILPPQKKIIIIATNVDRYSCIV